ncbi:MAG: tRNA (adenosine(37)-N6)-dimethylallyltransferase MiaA [Lachnospiraceae bacterium]|nr:tRNA (adenosine(37)-N6)-dimethylallyltransferase MiaA [Lachnospiraceae bacterium]
MKDLVIISGPTAVGKSKTAVELAKKINGSVISADSMQVYRGMDIGTAKISKEEMEGVDHFLIDVLDPADDFNIVMFKQMATEAMDSIYAADKIPIIAGGTLFYIQSLVYDIDFDRADEMTQFREEMYDLLEKKGSGYLHDMLKEVDPFAAQKIHENDHKRVIRALEYNRQTGGMISEHNRINSQKESPYNFCHFFLSDEREAVYQRINDRVDKMIEDGLVDEVKGLMEQGLTRDHVSMHGLGYKEMIDHLSGAYGLEEAVRLIKQGSRHYAKRQFTWARREKDMIFIDINSQDAVSVMIKALNKKGITDGHHRDV